MKGLLGLGQRGLERAVSDGFSGGTIPAVEALRFLFDAWLDMVDCHTAFWLRPPAPT